MNYFNLDNITIELANYILKNKTTIRATAKEFNIPKSTVHSLLAKKLKYLNYSLFLEVRNLLEENFKIKHIHGGEATRIKYLNLKNYEISTNEYVDTNNSL
ncbi:MAG: stage III sporulation protein D [Clostridiales bacterium]|nr:stage III sporulation protein D [Clostridiales bacterium]